MKPVILVRGGGDIASGAVYRLHRAGFNVIINEIAIPTMIRREVSYGNAVHMGEMVLERIVSRYISLGEAAELLKDNAERIVPVVTEAYAEVLNVIRPTVVVDAILAKRNIGTRMEDASFVIGVGPGFVAGDDVDVVVETMRGHRLGRCIYDGPAIPNTGVPGSIGGFTKERVHYAPEEGLFTARRHIGENVEKGEVIGFVNDAPVVAKITGVLRGILKTGLMVTNGFKLADIDARADEASCFSISDKAMSVGGGVMEALSAWQYKLECEGKI